MFISKNNKKKGKKKDKGRGSDFIVYRSLESLLT